MAQSAEREVEHDPAVVNDPLELRGRRAAVASHELSQAADVNGIESPQLELWRLTQFVGSSSFQKHQSLGGIVGIQFDGCLNGWQPVHLQHRPRWVALLQFFDLAGNGTSTFNVDSSRNWLDSPICRRYLSDVLAQPEMENRRSPLV